MDHLFHKNLLAEKHKLEWQLTQANFKIKNLEEQINKIKKQAVFSEEIGVPNTPPNTPPIPKWPTKPPFTRPLPDETRPVPMPKPKPPKPSPFDDFLRRYRNRPIVTVKESNGNPPS